MKYVNKYGRKDIKDFERRYRETSDYYDHKAIPKEIGLVLCRS